MRYLWASAALALGLSFNVAQAADKDLVIFDWAGYEDENFYLSYIVSMAISQPIHSLVMRKKRSIK